MTGAKPMRDVDQIVAGLSEAQKGVINALSAQWLLSVHTNRYDHEQPYYVHRQGRKPWHISPPEPRIQTRDALVKKGLIEPFYDAADLTPLGHEVRAKLQENG